MMRKVVTDDLLTNIQHMPTGTLKVGLSALQAVLAIEFDANRQRPPRV